MADDNKKAASEKEKKPVSAAELRGEKSKEGGIYNPMDDCGFHTIGRR